MSKQQLEKIKLFLTHLIQQVLFVIQLVFRYTGIKIFILTLHFDLVSLVDVLAKLIFQLIVIPISQRGTVI